MAWIRQQPISGTTLESTQVVRRQRALHTHTSVALCCWQVRQCSVSKKRRRSFACDCILECAIHCILIYMRGEQHSELAPHLEAIVPRNPCTISPPKLGMKYVPKLICCKEELTQAAAALCAAAQCELLACCCHGTGCATCTQRRILTYAAMVNAASKVCTPTFRTDRHPQEGRPWSSQVHNRAYCSLSCLMCSISRLTHTR